MSENELKTDPASIRISSQPFADPPVVAHRETLLGQLPSLQHQYVLVADDDEHIIGVVATSEINRRLLSPNPFERTRWASMPIGAMSKLSFSGTRLDGPVFDGEELKCSAIRQGDTLFGLSVDGDLFFSWKRLESLFSAALSDPLTGLMNRLAYERRMQEEWDRSLRTGTSIGVVVVDLDDFKTINDSYGHAVGDQVLIAVGRQLEASMRSYDVVARFGGDEFVALCLGCAPGDIGIPLERLVEALHSIEIKIDGGQTIQVSASVGAAVRHSGFDVQSADQLFVAADACLYESKESNVPAWKIELGTGQSEAPEAVRITAGANKLLAESRPS